MIAIRPYDFAAPLTVREYCYRNLDKVVGLKILTVMKPPTCSRGIVSMYKQQIAALESIKDRFAFNLENDVLCHPGRFDFVPPEDTVFYYQENIYELTPFGYLRHNGMGYCQMVANCNLWENHLRERLAAMESGAYHLALCEPGREHPQDCARVKARRYRAEVPDLGVRHGHNCSGSRDPGRAGRKIEMYVPNIPYWGNYKALLEKMELVPAEGGV